MKKQLENVYVPMSREQIVKLTTEVKEVLATEDIANQKRTFSAADLWNIHRHKKTNPGRRILV